MLLAVFPDAGCRAQFRHVGFFEHDTEPSGEFGVRPRPARAAIVACGSEARARELPGNGVAGRSSRQCVDEVEKWRLRTSWCGFSDLLQFYPRPGAWRMSSASLSSIT